MRATTVGLLAAIALAMGPFAHAASDDVSFDIVRFQVDGNSLIAPARVQELVAPFVGRRKVYGDIQKALEALENAYRSLGYGTVQVYAPEQELTTGVVRLQVTEAVIGKVTITGNKRFNAENIRASVPQLKEGQPPNMRQLSENTQLANENPAKQVELVLGISEEEGKVDAKIEVTEDDPERYYLTLDNTGTKASGKHRIGFSYQNANLGNSDQVLTLAYLTALDAPGGVKVDIYSIGYRMPLYAIGDSIDLIYANSSTNTPATIANISPLGISGKGEVFGLRYNHIFPRAGVYTSRLVLGLDYKHINARCTLASGAPVAPGTSAGCTPYTLRPVSATYSGQWMKPGEAIDFNVGVMHHLFPMGSHFTGAGGIDRYSFVTTRATTDTFSALRLGGSYTRALPEDWLVRAAISGQYAQNPLPSGEQIGLAGSSAVRGFLERAVSSDRGYFANIELYSPDYGPRFGLPGNLKALAFYDWASGHNLGGLAAPQFSRANIASAGLGLRYNVKKDISARFDLARVLEGHQPTPGNSAEAAKPGDIRGHFSIAVGF